MNTVTLTIDGVSVTVPSDYTILEAAKEASINIPTLCYLKDVIQLADEIGFYANTHGYDINLSLNYYTHAIFHHGRQLRP